MMYCCALVAQRIERSAPDRKVSGSIPVKCTIYFCLAQATERHMIMDLKSKFRHVDGFPEEGIDFIDITTVLGDKDAFKEAMDQLIETAKEFKFDVVVAPESRGFILGTPIAYELGAVITSYSIHYTKLYECPPREIRLRV